jgi:hypothetical protein
MKFNLTLAALLMILGTTATFAQTTTEPVSENQPQARMGRNRPDPETMANRQADRLAKELNLDDATKQKVHDAALKQAQSMSANMSNSSTSREDRMKAMKANSDEFDASMKTTLSADQYKKYQEMKEKMKDERGARGMRNPGNNE